MSKPPVPSVEDEGAVVRWFLEHDDQLADVRTNYEKLLENIEQEVLVDLRDFTDADSLRAHFTKVREAYGEKFLPWAAELRERGGSYDEAAETVFFAEALAATKLRILGYFLKERYDLDPADL